MVVRQLFAAFGIASVGVIVMGVAAACGDDPAPAADPNSSGEAGLEGGGGDTERPDVQVTNPNEAKQKGRVVDATSKFSVTAPVITIAGRTVTGGADGTYEIIVPKNVPYSMSVTAEEHWKLNEQEWIVKKDLFDRTDTSLLSSSIAGILASFLPPRDAKKGILVVRVNPLPPCDSETGSTISIEPAGTAKVTYFKSGKPDKTATSATKDESFSAAVSDVDPGVNVKVTIQSPTCEQLPFPIDYQDVTYTGNQKAEAGDVLSYIRVFIGPKKIQDSGAD